MTSTSKNNKKTSQELHEEETAELEAIRARVKARRLRAARELAGRLQVKPDGSREFIRFNSMERLQHQILIGSFTALGFTGLMQSFSRFNVVAWVINILLGGVETLRVIHHLAAFVFGVQAIYHFGEIAYLWFIRREKGSMWPSANDFKDLVATFKFNLNLSKEHAKPDRYSIEEKVEYWALLWGTVIMGITGIFQGFPMLVTSIMPGEAIPISRTIHAWEAILAVASILTWHMYHTVIKEKNKSIFTGVMSEDEMIEAHPMEYRRILAAAEFVRKAEAQGLDEMSEQVESHHEMAELGTTD